MINELFGVHKLNARGMANAEKIGAAFTALLDAIDPLCVDGRHLSVARTKLEEAAFFAKKAMATRLENQDVGGLEAAAVRATLPEE